MPDGTWIGMSVIGNKWLSRFESWLIRGWYHGGRGVLLLLPFSWLFRVIGTLRTALYRIGILPITQLACPVIVVGNITAGGTGKTPFVIWLANALLEQGLNIGVITRGYGGRAVDTPRIVLPDSDPKLVGDEAVLLARRCHCPVIACSDRVGAARALLSRSNLDLIISDDGLQHYRLARIMQIVMIDGARGLGNRHFLPAGPLRESPLTLSQADLMIIKMQPNEARRYFGEGITMRLKLGSAMQITGSTVSELQKFCGRKVHAVAGIARPEGFFNALQAAGIEIIPHPLSDHAQLFSQDVNFGDDLPVLMTEKDAVKCREYAGSNHWYIPITAEIAAGDTAIILEQVMAKLDQFMKNSEKL